MPTLVIQESGGNTEYDIGINSASPTTSLFQNTDISAGVHATSGGILRAFMQFVLSSIPSTATITSATLTLNISSASNNTVNVHYVSGAWVPPGWTAASAWNGLNGLMEAPVIASFAAGNGGTFVSVSITSMVQAWVSGTHANYGLCLNHTDETTQTNNRTIIRSRYTGTAANRPQLTVVYEETPANITTSITGSSGTLVGGASSASRSRAASGTSGILAGGSATIATNSVGVQTATIVGSAGALVGGTASTSTYSVLHTTITGSDGAIVGGSASVVKRFPLEIDGGAIAGGDATIARSASISSTSGAVTGGSAPVTRARATVSVGGAIVGGTSPTSTGIADARSVSIVGAGGAVTGGTSAIARKRSSAASSGAILGGIGRSVRTQIAFGIAGILIGGTAQASRSPHLVGSAGTVSGGASLITRSESVTGSAGAFIGGDAIVTADSRGTSRIVGSSGVLVGGSSDKFRSIVVVGSSGLRVGARTTLVFTQKVSAQGTSLADRLIAKYGRPVTLQTFAPSTANQTHPWKGADVVTQTVVTVGAFVDPTSVSKLGRSVAREELLARVKQVVLVPPNAMDLEKSTTLVDGLINYAVDWVEVLRPGRDVRLYIFGVKR